MEQNGMHQQAVIQVQGNDLNFITKEENLNAEEDPTTDDQKVENETTVIMKGEEEGDDLKSDNTNIISQFDSTDAFNAALGDRRAFDSWDEFTDFLEEFQTKSGTRFKPRGACRVNHVNERRIGDPIPDRFVYAAVKMICVHFGDGGSGKKKSYMGKGCQAFMRVSHNRGAMQITQKQLIHYNHDPIYEDNHKLTRNFRVFNFTEELDQILAKEVLRANPFQYKNGEKEWTKVLDRLKEGDERFASITARLFKRRIRFLLDNFAAITEGRKPPAEDEMGTILYELNIAKKEGVPEIASTTATPVGTRKSGRGRPRKVSLSDYEDDPTHDDDDYVASSPPPSATVETRKKRGRGRPRKVSPSDYEDNYDEDFVSYTPAKKTAKKTTASLQTPNTSSSQSVSNNSGGDFSQLVSYFKQRDQEDRKLRQKDMDLRKEELAFQKQLFEFEKTERKAHMDLLKSQIQMFEESMLKQQQQQQQQQQQPQQQPQQQEIMPMTVVQWPTQPQPSITNKATTTTSATTHRS